MHARLEPPAPVAGTARTRAVARAWRSLRVGPAFERLEVQRARRAGPGFAGRSTVCRLVFSSGSGHDVIAKGGPAHELAHERRIYEEILPRIGVTAPHYLGVSDDDRGWSWLFVEAAGEDRLTLADPAQRRLAARWLGRLHRSAADLGPACGLPDLGPGRFRRHLRDTVGAMRHAEQSPALVGHHHDLVQRLRERLETLDSGWFTIERALEHSPRTLVHGCFRSRTVRVGRSDGRARLFPMDWETAGWGTPAVDLALGGSVIPWFTVEVDAYARMVRGRWPELEPRAIARLALVGHLFHALARLDRITAGGRLELRIGAGDAVRDLCACAAQIGRVLRLANGWQA